MLDQLEEKLGFAPWVFESVLAALLAIVLVFLAGELVLAIFRRRVDVPALG